MRRSEEAGLGFGGLRSGDPAWKNPRSSFQGGEPKVPRGTASQTKRIPSTVLCPESENVGVYAGGL